MDQFYFLKSILIYFHSFYHLAYYIDKSIIMESQKHLIIQVYSFVQETMECPSCFLRYSPTHRRPNIIPCGHTICLKCLRNSSNCKICNQPIDPNKDETINYSLMEIIQKDIREIDKYLKVCFVGSSMTGKTSLIKRLIVNTFSDDTVTTIGYDFSFCDRLVDQLSVRYQLWDSAGQQKYRAISPIHYKNADIVVIVYDVSLSEDENKISYWIEQSLISSPEGVKIIIAGNKLDLLHEGKHNQPFDNRTIKQIQNCQYPHLLISCKSGSGVNQFWECLDEQLRKKLKEKRKKMSNFEKEIEEIERKKEKMGKIKRSSSNGIGLKSKNRNNCC